MEIQYDSVPAYCNHYRHLSHSEYTCEIRLKDEDKKKRKEEEQKIEDNHHKATTSTTKVVQESVQRGRPKYKEHNQNQNQLPIEHRKAIEHQNSVHEAPEEEW